MVFDSLLTAVMKPDVAVAKFLLDQGENVNASDNLRRTLLHHSVLKPHVDIIRLLLEHGANVNAFDSSHKTPLHHAVLEPHVDNVKLLLEHGANVNAVDNRRKTPLRHAVLKPHANIVKLLLENGAYVHAINEFDDFKKCPYDYNIVKYIAGRIKEIWESGTGVKQLERIRKYSLFLVAGIPPADIVKLLLNHRLNSSGQIPLKEFGLDPHECIVKLLLEHGSYVNAFDRYRRTPLHNFVLESRAGVVKLLLEHGANINAVDYLRQTPLHYAVLKPRTNMVKLLLQHGANVNVLDDAYLLPLHHAVLKPHAIIVKLLLEYGANVNAVDNSLRTPLHYAALRHHLEIVKLLLDHGANVNALDKLNQTPMHYFLIESKLEISLIYTLMKYGANVNAVDQYGMHVLSAAVRNQANPYEVVKLFLENGAIPDFDNETNILVGIALPEQYNLAKLLIQYIILRISGNYEMFEVLDQFESVLSVHIATYSQIYNDFLKIAHSCFNEIENMKDEFICEQTLFQFVSNKCLRTATNDQSVALCNIDELFLLLRNGKYVACRDLIYAAFKRSAVIDRLCELEISYLTPDNVTVTLNYVCIENLSKHLSKGDVINLSTVFYNEFNYHVLGTKLSISYQTPDRDTLTLNYNCIGYLTNYMLKDDVINLFMAFCDKFSNYEYHITHLNLGKENLEQQRTERTGRLLNSWLDMEFDI